MYHPSRTEQAPGSNRIERSVNISASVHKAGNDRTLMVVRRKKPWTSASLASWVEAAEANLEIRGFNASKCAQLQCLQPGAKAIGTTRTVWSAATSFARFREAVCRRPRMTHRGLSNSTQSDLKED